jgi:adenosine deaminase
MVLTLVVLFLVPQSLQAAPRGSERQTVRYFESIRHQPAFLRPFLQAFPKGGDLHSHLGGALYGETLLAWAAEDGLCADMSVPALRTPEPGKPCVDQTDPTGKPLGWISAKDVAASATLTDTLVDGISMRSYVPTPGWSGHDQFFVTFERMDARPERFGDMLAAVSARAGRQNLHYLELMTSLNRGSVYQAALATPWADDLATVYANLMSGPLGNNMEALIKEAQEALDYGESQRRTKLGCDTTTPDPGCAVEIRYLYQVIRVGPKAGTFAGFIFGFELAKRDTRVVGINLVAPEDDPTAIANYTLNMEMIDLLWQQKGPINISLHAGELTLGLVPPRDLSFHIRQAIEIGHAKRIGHGIDIPYEHDMVGLLTKMRDEKILVEINLTSNDVILGIKGDDHPFNLYRASGVPMALSTDDEGVSRIDLTHEYMRAVETYGLTYLELKHLSRNSLAYSFLSPDDKAKMQQDLEARFAAFEANVAKWPRP